jgi:hypothetical protein
MRPSGLTRVVVALTASASLLFAQLAVAAFVCPELEAAAATALSADDAQMDDCAHLNVELPSLCQPHCEPDSQRAHTPHLPPVQAFVAAELSVVICDSHAVALTHTLERDAPTLKRSTAPPLVIRNCCFRI